MAKREETQQLRMLSKGHEDEYSAGLPNAWSEACVNVQKPYCGGVFDSFENNL